MAANADRPNGELSETTDEVHSATSPDPTEHDSLGSAAETESTSDSEAAAIDAAADEAEDYDAAIGEAAVEDDAAADDEDDDAAADDADVAQAKQRMSHLRVAAIAGVSIVVALAAIVGWLGFRSYQSHNAEAQRQAFIQIGRQGALNLTTIDWQHAEADVQRVLDSATGQFYDQFSKRKQPFIDVLKKAQSKSVGTITEAGLESEAGDKAEVLVAVAVRTTNLGVEEPTPRQWRMRITVEKSGNETKISNVAFVP